MGRSPGTVRLLALLTIGLAAGCRFDPPPLQLAVTAADDGGGDAGAPADVGLADAAPDLDAAGLDAGHEDAAPPDAEPPDGGDDDAGLPDLGGLDAGGEDDAALDAGPPGICGDGVVDPGEGCDDGGRLGGDGCDPRCAVELGWTCLPAPAPCVRDQDTIWVDPFGPSCLNGNGDGSRADPVCALGDGLATPATTLVLGSGTYAGSFAVGAGRRLLIVGASGARIDGGNGIALTIEGGADVTLIGVQLASVDADALKVHQMGTRAHVEATVLGPSYGLGADVKNGTTVVFRRNRVEANGVGGLKIDTDDGWILENNIVVGNGLTGNEFGGVYLKKASSNSRFVNNTVVDNTSDAARPSGVRCDVADTRLRNSILWDNHGGPPTNAFCVTDHSVIGPGVAVGGTDRDIDPLLNRRQHLQAGSPCIDAGDPAGTQANGGPAPDDDVDGDRRSGPVDIGADERR